MNNVTPTHILNGVAGQGVAVDVVHRQLVQGEGACGGEIRCRGDGMAYGPTPNTAAAAGST